MKSGKSSVPVASSRQDLLANSGILAFWLILFAVAAVGIFFITSLELSRYPTTALAVGHMMVVASAGNWFDKWWRRRQERNRNDSEDFSTSVD